MATIGNEQPSVKLPPSKDPVTGVNCKDVSISMDPNVSARIFLPPVRDARRLPVLLFVHGGGFSRLSTFAEPYHSYLVNLTARAHTVTVSVEYRLAPKNPIPACYDDCWKALQWVGCHAGGDGPEAWLNEHADLKSVFLAGDSAGGNICHTLAYRVGTVGVAGVKVVVTIMCHPYFGGVEEIDEYWMSICPENEGMEDPRMKPPVEHLEKLGCEKVVIFVAENDRLNLPGKAYAERLKKSGWRGEMEVIEQKGASHCFFVLDHTTPMAVAFIDQLVSFINVS